LISPMLLRASVASSDPFSAAAKASLACPVLRQTLDRLLIASVSRAIVAWARSTL
jgi:hypothetical protein